VDRKSIYDSQTRSQNKGNDKENYRLGIATLFWPVFPFL